jgi:oxaloacetate decarboxylase alpha subunit
MASIELIDTTVRDGNQSLWGATGLTTGMLTEIAPTMDRVRFGAIDFTTSTHMAVAVRYQREDPWERIRLVREAMPNTPLSFLTTGMRFISWEIASAEFMQLAFSLLVSAGIRRVSVMDPMNDTAAMNAMAALARDVGVETTVAALTYTVSPFHDDAYFVARARELAGSGRFDRIYIKDPGGLLTPERALSLLPAVHAAIADIVLELHSHCTIALAPFTYLASVDLGVRALHVAVRPLANGASQPSAESTVANLRDNGHRVDIDDQALLAMSAYFAALADAEGLEQGKPVEYDTSYFRHQMPGGMLGTLRRQLSEMKRLPLLPQVLEETERVRADLGYPIMVTPFSQVVGAQAVMNVVNGKRYEAIPDEVIRYVIGRFGQPAMKVEANLEDRIRSGSRAKELELEPGMLPLPELRKRFGAALRDEEFVLRATMPPDQVDAMLAAGPAQRGYDPSTRPTMELLRGLASRRDVDQIFVETKGVRMEFNRSAHPRAGAKDT